LRLCPRGGGGGSKDAWLGLLGAAGPIHGKPWLSAKVWCQDASAHVHVGLVPAWCTLPARTRTCRTANATDSAHLTNACAQPVHPQGGRQAGRQLHQHLSHHVHVVHAARVWGSSLHPQPGARCAWALACHPVNAHLPGGYPWGSTAARIPSLRLGGGAPC